MIFGLYAPAALVKTLTIDALTNNRVYSNTHWVDCQTLRQLASGPTQ